VPIPVYAEMGSVNPIVVTEGALQARSEKIVEGLTASVSNFGGQLCTKPGEVFVPAGAEGDAFAADRAAERAHLRAGGEAVEARTSPTSSSAAPPATAPAGASYPAAGGWRAGIGGLGERQLRWAGKRLPLGGCITCHSMGLQTRCGKL
jgi:acyl-CoA reductase-like NAD-dependent aldehyde dehydrogenase